MQPAERRTFTVSRLAPLGASNGQLAKYIDSLKAWRPASPAGSGDMEKATYDPQGVGMLIYRVDMKTDDLVIGDV